MEKITLCLLINTHNETNEALTLIKRFYNIVNEIVIIDTSNKVNYKILSNLISPYNIKLYKFPDLGINPLQYGFAFKLIDSEYILLLDPGEVPSDGLIENLKNFCKHESYGIRRYEKPYDNISWQTRIFKKNSIIFSGFIHEQIKTNENLVKIRQKNCYIEQSSDINNIQKIKRYLVYDLIERPLTYNYIIQKIPYVGKYFKLKNQSISEFTFKIFNILYSYYIYLNTNCKNEALSHIKYMKDKYEISKIINKKDQMILKNVYNEIKRYGIINYLNLDDINYINILSNEFGFSQNGVKNFLYLLYYRYKYRETAKIIDIKIFNDNPLYNLLNNTINEFFNKVL